MKYAFFVYDMVGESGKRKSSPINDYIVMNGWCKGTSFRFKWWRVEDSVKGVSLVIYLV